MKTQQEKLNKQINNPIFKELDARFLKIRPVIMGVAPYWHDYHLAFKMHKIAVTKPLSTVDFEFLLDSFKKQIDLVLALDKRANVK